jgi:hypothetical protein
MKKLPEIITDPVYVKPASFNALDRFFLKLIRDERDLPFIRLTLASSLVLIPLGISLYFLQAGTWIWWTITIVYLFVNNFVYKGPFGLMLHCTSHRALFKKDYNFLNNYIPWILAPFFGHSPETYFAHHIGMHHSENNMEEDESSTISYNRDSLRGFTHYFLKFLFFSIYNLPAYFIRKRRRKFLNKYMRGELLFFTFCIALCFISWQATLVVFIIPMITFRLVAMMGNWAQHSFVDQQEPDNEFKNSITCINTKYNVKCWNDGYHISHHERPAMHWTEHPVHFKKTLNEYVENKAIVFDSIHFLHVFIYLMRKRYDLLAKHYVDLDGRFANDKEVEAFLVSRTRRVEPQARLSIAG